MISYKIKYPQVLFGVRYIILIVLCISAFNAYAQRENVWAFGEFGGLDFNNGNPVPISTSIDTYESSASVCDMNGRLLFYTDGTKVWDRNHNLMPNGSGLNSIIAGGRYSSTGSTAQGTVIVPMPDSALKYYIFSLTSVEQRANAGRLYYSVVDMTLNNGFGDVELSKKAVLLDTGLQEQMTAVVGNNCNIWLLVCSKAPDPRFKAFDVNALGINSNPVISTVGLGAVSPGSLGTGAVGVMVASWNRQKIAVTLNASGNTFLYDFDASTGLISNPIDLQNTDVSYGACFSPDDSKLYIQCYRGGGRLDQYDVGEVNPAAIIASRTNIGNTSMLSQLKMGPDKKMYFLSAFGYFLGVINKPDDSAMLCQYEAYTSIAVKASLGFLGSGFVGCFPSAVPLWIRDTIYTANTYRVPCFANQEFVLRIPPGASNYIWEDGGTDTMRTITNSGTYWVQYDKIPCSRHVDTFKIIIPTSIVPLHDFIQQGCKGIKDGLAWVHPAAGDTNQYTYSWFDATGHILQQNTYRQRGDTLWNIGGEVYTVQIKGSNGCDTSFKFDLSIPLYKASFIVDSIVCMQHPVSFQNTSIGNNTTYIWDFGDGNNVATLSNPTHQYEQAGTYNVTLIAQSQDGCFDTAHKKVTVDSLLAIAFVLDKSNICEGQGINVIPKWDSTAIELLWDFGDGNIQSGGYNMVHLCMSR